MTKTDLAVQSKGPSANRAKTSGRDNQKPASLMPVCALACLIFALSGWLTVFSEAGDAGKPTLLVFPSQTSFEDMYQSALSLDAEIAAFSGASKMITIVPKRDLSLSQFRAAGAIIALKSPRAGACSPNDKRRTRPIPARDPEIAASESIPSSANTANR